MAYSVRRIMDMHTFNSTGAKPGPARAALIAKARKRLNQPWVTYQIISTCGDGSQTDNGYDIVDDKNCDHVLVARSRIEALVAFFDYLNESVPTREGHDHYANIDANDLSEFLPYFEHDPRDDQGLWFRELPTTRIAHHVLELSDNLDDVPCGQLSGGEKPSSDVLVITASSGGVMSHTIHQVD